MNKPVSFEVAKLLKEKGFKEQSSCFYTKPNSKMFGVDEHGRFYPIKNNPKTLWVIGKEFTLNEENVYSAPTIAEVVMWMYEKHGLWISVSVNPKIERFISNIYENHLYKCSIYGQTNERNENGWDTPTKAYEAAIQYCLNNLID